MTYPTPYFREAGDAVSGIVITRFVERVAPAHAWQAEGRDTADRGGSLQPVRV